MGLIPKIASRIRQIRAGRASPKKIMAPSLSTPSYLNRHLGATFLVLGNGPSLRTHRGQIDALIEMHRPIVMGANNITGFTYPDYHAFTNRRRFISYAHTIDSDRSRVLVGVYLPEWIISEYYGGPYERIMYVNDHDQAFDIRDGTSADVNADFIPDECELIGDINNDEIVNTDDLLMILSAWGNLGGIEDINNDGVVNVEDLLLLLGQWR